MLSNMKHSLLFFFILVNLNLRAQSNLAIGDWAAHIPYNFGLSVTQSPSYVYYSTDLGIIRIDKENRSQYEYITRIDGLSRAEKSVVKYHPGTQSLVIAYESGVIDILRSSGVTTMKDISQFDNFPIDKKLNHMYVDGQEAVVISGNFGISRVDVKNGKVLWTAFTDNNAVRAVSRANNIYYAATEDGLYSIPVTGQTENFQAWRKMDDSDGLSGNTSASSVVRWQDKIYAGIDTSIYYINDSSGLFEIFHSFNDFECIHLSGEHRRLISTWSCGENCDAEVIDFHPGTYEPTLSSFECTSRTLEAIEDEIGWVYYADRFNGFRMAPGNGTTCSPLFPNAPYSNNIHEIAIMDNGIAIATGGTVNGFGYSFRNDGFFNLDETGDWTVKNLFNTQELKDRDLKGFHRVKIHPLTGDQYYGTYWAGIVVYHQDGSYSFYDADNSTLSIVDPGDPRERIVGMEFDQNANLWVASFLATEYDLAVLKNDGTWIGYNPPNFGSGPNELAIDSIGNKWIAMTGDASRGVYVFNEGDMDDQLDDEYYIFNQNNSELPTNRAICLTVDLDGDVWVGTDEGAVVFACGGGIFEGNCRGNRPKVLQDTILALLLETEEVRCIAVDGANRKWFGTTNGVFVQSPSGEEQVAFFNTENSPLLSNIVNDISIDQKTGLVYIGTEKGLNVYRTDAISGGRSHALEVVAFPNPVRPGYEGPIAIKGLPQDADVKITDVSGTLIFETTSLGGQAVWDGKDYNGVKAKSGVYLVFSTGEANGLSKPSSLVSKILIMN